MENKKLNLLTTRDEVEIYGVWSLTLKGLNNPQEFRPGILKFSNNNWTVKLIDGFIEISKTEQKIDTLFGKSLDGEIIQLNKCNMERSVINFNSEISTDNEIVTSQELIILNNGSEISGETVLKSVSFEYDDLDNILFNALGYEMSIDATNTIINLKIKRNQPVIEHLGNFVIHDKKFQLESYITSTMHLPQIKNGNNMIFNFSKFLVVTSSLDININELLIIESEIVNFLKIFTGKNIFYNKLLIRECNKALANSIFFGKNSINLDNLKNLSYSEQIDLKNIFYDSFPTLISNWFQKQELLKKLCDNYLLTLKFNETIENQLINLTEGIEGYYKTKNISLLNKLVCMFGHFSDELNTYLDDSLKKKYEFLSSNKQIEDNIGNKTFLSKYPILCNYLFALKQTRVNIAHGENKEGAITDFKELIICSELFKYLERLFILKQLGFEKDTDLRIKSKISNIINTTFYD